jgi:hypothetical protein
MLCIISKDWNDFILVKIRKKIDWPPGFERNIKTIMRMVNNYTLKIKKKKD